MEPTSPGALARHTYNLSVARTSQPELWRALGSGDLTETGERLSGLPEAAVYAPSRRRLQLQSAVGEGQFGICGTLDVDLWRLPPAMYAALMRDSPAVGQLACTDLRLSSGTELSPAAARRWWRELAGAVAAGSQQGLPPQLAQGGDVAHWRRDASRLVRWRRCWYLSLTFDVPIPVRRPGLRRAMGMDVGLQPLVTLVSAAGTLQVAGVTPPHSRHWPLHSPMTADHLALRRRLVAAATRSALAEVVEAVETGGRYLALERLDLSSFGGDFVQRAREIGLTDFLLAELPQRLHFSRVGLTYVRPALTSLRCARCGSTEPGQRTARRFACARCGHHDDADVNAARNILARARGERRRRGLR